MDIDRSAWRYLCDMKSSVTTWIFESEAHVNPCFKRGEGCGLTFSTVKKHWIKHNSGNPFPHKISAICELPTFCPNLWISGQTSRLLRVDPRKKISNDSWGSRYIHVKRTEGCWYVYTVRVSFHIYIYIHKCRLSSFMLLLFRSMISVNKYKAICDRIIKGLAMLSAASLCDCMLHLR